jgi:FlaA1/EpsC-like NDP-sugar epimerase
MGAGNGVRGMRGSWWTWFASRSSQVRADLAFAALDVVLTSAAYAGLLLIRFDGKISSAAWSDFGRFLPVALLVHLFVGAAWGLHGNVWSHASIEEARRIILAGATSTAFLVVYALVFDTAVPWSVVVLGGGVSVALVGATRFQARLFAVHRNQDKPSASAGLHTLIVGAGEAGAQIIQDMRRHPEEGIVPVGFLDDDARKWGRLLHGVRVLGPLDDLATQVEISGVHQVVLAIRTVSRDVIRQLADDAERVGVPLRLVPMVSELLGGRASLRDIRDVQIEDLLGREQVETDLEAVRSLLRGRRVLITGGGGSIGSEIARQVAVCAPAELVLLDHDETHLYDAAGTVSVPVAQALADIRDRERLVDVFLFHRPEIVFHAAAHKHVPLLEEHPCEAAATNVLGTANVVHAAEVVGVERLVFISTDKAVRPANVMGATKRLGEQIVLGSGATEGRRCAVRFGNVLGSRGSVIPTFMRQITAGGPVTLTDPRMRRFFMSIEEAVQLVLQAAALAEGGEIFMLEMGEQVSIADLAARMVRLSGRQLGTDVELRVIGPRPGEKMIEELHAPEESLHATTHPSIVGLHPQLPAQASIDEALERIGHLVSKRSGPATTALLFTLAGVQEPDDDVDIDLRDHAGPSPSESADHRP